VVRIERALHALVAFVTMPLFALANAGVPLGRVDLGAPGSAAVLGGVAAGLLVGKPLGIVAISALAVRLRLATLPRGVGWRGVAAVGAVSGIGFTMAIFSAGLAFPDGTHLGVAKLGVLIATAASGALGLGLGRFALPPAPARRRRALRGRGLGRGLTAGHLGAQAPASARLAVTGCRLLAQHANREAGLAATLETTHALDVLATPSRGPS